MQNQYGNPPQTPPQHPMQQQYGTAHPPQATPPQLGPYAPQARSNQIGLAAGGSFIFFIGAGLFISSEPLLPLVGVFVAPAGIMMALTATIRGSLFGWWQKKR